MNDNKRQAITDRIGHVSIALAQGYAARGGLIESEEFQQVMWVALLEREHDQTFTARPTNQIVNKLAWVARDWARREFNLHTNRNVEVEGMVDDDANDPWEFLALEIENPYPTLDLAEAVEDVVTALGGITARIAHSLMAGYTKRQTADRLEIGPSLVTYHLGKMKAALSQAGLAA